MPEHGSTGGGADGGDGRLDSVALVFTIEPDGATWTVVGPAAAGAPYTSANPLRDPGFRRALAEFESCARGFVVRSATDLAARLAAMTAPAAVVGERLTSALCSSAARMAMQRRIVDKDRGRARLTIRMHGTSPDDDQILALPWELIMPWPGRFAVREFELDVERELVLDGAPAPAPPAEPLTVAVGVAAPSDQHALSPEREMFRLVQVLSLRGQRTTFADLGNLRDFVDAAARSRATALHFSGHGLPGALVFEDDVGASAVVSVEELVSALNLALTDPTRSSGPDGGPRRFPRLFFLSSCHGASPALAGRADRGHVDGVATRDVVSEGALARGPSTAAALHRAGFAQVVGYYGPVADQLATEANVAFYDALGRGESTLQAVALAREVMTGDVDSDGVRSFYPLAWAQLALYRRGDDLPLACRRPADAGWSARGWARRTIQVSGLPVVELGFIGRRLLQHDLRRRVRAGQRLLVLQGLGGIGKTALATQILTTIVRGDVPPLILRCGGLHPDDAFVDDLRRQVEDHLGGKGLRILDDEALAAVHERVAARRRGRALLPPADRLGRVDPVDLFEATCIEALDRLTQTGLSLIVYVDNAESLQVGPATTEPGQDDVGSWHPAALRWWLVIERLSERTPVIASTRYGWVGLAPEAHVPVGPMPVADILRMMETFPVLAALPGAMLASVADQVDGHPRTVERLSGFLLEERARLGIAATASHLESQVAALIRTRQAITDDLLLALLWKRLGDGPRAHARALCLLRRPAPVEVVLALGSPASLNVLAAASLLTRFPVLVSVDGASSWEDRWGFHSIVREFVNSSEGVEPGDLALAVHRAAGLAYDELATTRGATAADARELVFHLHAAGAADQAWPAVKMLAQLARDRGAYLEAVELLEESERAGVSGDRLAANLAAQVGARRAAGDFGPAQLERGDRAVRAALDDEVRAYAHFELASLAARRGDFAAARRHLELARVGDASGPTREDSAVAAGLTELANVLRAGNDLPGARSLLERAIAIQRRVRATDEHIDIATAMSELGIVLHLEGDLDTARQLLEQSLAIKRRVFATETHPSVAATVHALGGVLRDQGDLVGARWLLERALEIQREVLPSEEHPDIAGSLHELARVLLRLGDRSGARSLLERARAIETAVHHGSDHLSCALTELMLAQVLWLDGDVLPAAEMAVHAHAVLQAALGDEHDRTRWAAQLVVAIAAAFPDEP